MSPFQIGKFILSYDCPNTQYLFSSFLKKIKKETETFVSAP